MEEEYQSTGKVLSMSAGRVSGGVHWDSEGYQNRTRGAYGRFYPSIPNVRRKRGPLLLGVPRPSCRRINLLDLLEKESATRRHDEPQ